MNDIVFAFLCPLVLLYLVAQLYLNKLMPSGELTTTRPKKCFKLFDLCEKSIDIKAGKSQSRCHVLAAHYR